jgi:hypothetical protein
VHIFCLWESIYLFRRKKDGAEKEKNKGPNQEETVNDVVVEIAIFICKCVTVSEYTVCCK